jgi:hypothetical protein
MAATGWKTLAVDMLSTDGKVFFTDVAGVRKDEGDLVIRQGSFPHETITRIPLCRVSCLEETADEDDWRGTAEGFRLHTKYELVRPDETVLCKHHPKAHRCPPHTKKALTSHLKTLIR